MSAIRHLPLALAIGLSIAPASAAPRPRNAPMVSIELEHSSVSHRLDGTKLPQAVTAPGGLQVTATAPADLLVLGFRAGDIIVAHNGSPVGDSFDVGDGINLYDVIRNRRQLVVRVFVQPASRRSRTIEARYFTRLLDIVSSTDLRSSPVHDATGITGVRVIDTRLALYLECEVGDLIRTIDARPIRSDADLTAGIRNLRIGATDVVLDRFGTEITLTLVRKAPLDVKGIKQLTAKRFEVSQAFADAVIADHDVLARDLEVTPYVVDGRQHGFTVFNIKPDAPGAHLGLRDGDVVLDIDNHSIDTLGDQIDAASDLEHATGLTLHLLRGGKRVSLDYVIK